MNRTKYLMKNTAILFISNFASKMLVFFLLPLYTSILSTEDYGISDLLTTTVHILYIILTMCVANGIIRFAMNNTEDQDEMLSIGVSFTILSSLLVAIGSYISLVANLFPSMNPYYGYLVSIYVLSCFSAILNAFSKGKERIRLIGIAGVVSTAVRIVFSILFLVVVPLGINGYLISIVICHISSCLVFLVGGLLKETKPKRPSIEKIKLVVNYSAPIAAAEIGWLICTSSDKYIVSMMLGASATGLISVAHRLPTILTTITNVFIQAWTLSAIKESEKKDTSEYYSNMFKYYSAFAITVGAVLILATKIIAAFLFRGDFFVAWVYTPIYLSALVVNTMSSFAGSIISAGKDTKPLFSSTFAGAILNVILDIILIKYMGIYGAGVATGLSYMLIFAMRIISVRKNFDLKIEYKKLLTLLAFLFILTATMIFSDNTVFYVVSAVLTLLIIVFNYDTLYEIVKEFSGILKKTAKSKQV